MLCLDIIVCNYNVIMINDCTRLRCSTSCNTRRTFLLLRALSIKNQSNQLINQSNSVLMLRERLLEDAQLHRLDFWFRLSHAQLWILNVCLSVYCWKERRLPSAVRLVCTTAIELEEWSINVHGLYDCLWCACNIGLTLTSLVHYDCAWYKYIV